MASGEPCLPAGWVLLCAGRQPMWSGECLLSTDGLYAAPGPCTSIMCFHGVSQKALLTVSFSTEYLASPIILDLDSQT